jgi:hypothetical protein
MGKNRINHKVRRARCRRLILGLVRAGVLS